MTNHGERFDRIEAAIERLSQRTNERFDSLTQYVLNLREETGTRLEAIEGRLSFISSTMTSIDARIPALTKAVIDAGAISSQMLLAQAKQKESAIDFVARLEKLEETVSKHLNPAA